MTDEEEGAFDATDGAEVRAELERQGISQATLARHLDIGPDMVNKALSGTRKFTAPEVDKIRAFLGASGDAEESDGSTAGEHVAVRIGHQRRALGWTQERLAQEAGIEVNSVRKHERGLHLNSLHTLQRYAQALGVDIAELISEKAAAAFRDAPSLHREAFVRAVEKALAVNRESALGLTDRGIAELAFSIHEAGSGTFPDAPAPKGDVT